MSIYQFKAELKSPVIAVDYGLGLDSLLAAAMFTATGKVKHDALKDVSIAKSEHMLEGKSFTLYHASCGFFTAPTVYAKETIVRSRRASEMGPEFYDATKKLSFDVNQKSNEWKAILNHYRTVTTPAIVWFIDTDEPEQIKELLASLGFIGKRRGQGWGELGKITYKLAPHASAIIDLSGYPLRPIPSEIWKPLQADHVNAPESMSSGYTISAWEADALLCAMPLSPMIDLSHSHTNTEEPFFQFKQSEAA